MDEKAEEKYFWVLLTTNIIYFIYIHATVLFIYFDKFKSNEGRYANYNLSCSLLFYIQRLLDSFISRHVLSLKKDSYPMTKF